MPNITLGENAKQEICDALVGLSGARARAEAMRLAQHFDVSLSRIYDVTRHLRPKRKPRADKGKRRADLLQHEGLRLTAELCALKHVDPDLAIETAQANGHAIPVSLGTVRRYLREHGLNRSQLRHGRRPYRRWEAANPLDIFQLDMSGVKERWVDVTSRRILHVTPLTVSKNHPNKNSSLVPLWKFGLVDDHSRVRYVRYVACQKPNSIHVIEFLLGAFRDLGIPLSLYSDNDAVIVSRRMRRAASILDRAFAESGGFKLEQHAAGNPQATGKVEVGHQIFEKFEKLIGVKYETPGLDALNDFTIAVCDRYNWTTHRDTGVQPMLRFRSGHAAMRVAPDALLDDAFKADEFEVSIRADLTISFQSERYQLPRSPRVAGLPNPFLSLAGRRGVKITVVWPPNADYFVAIVDGNEYEIERRLASSDPAGEFRSVAETVGQQTVKALQESAADRKRTHKAAGTDLIVPGIDVPFAAGLNSQILKSQISDSEIAPASDISNSEIAVFPRKKIETNPEMLAALGAGIVPPSMVDGQLIDLWSAASMLAEEGLFERNDAGQVSTVDMDWLKSIYAGRDEMLDTELRQALQVRAGSGSDRVISMRSA